MTFGQLEKEGFVAIERAFTEDSPGLMCLKQFVSQIRSQQVCLDFEEVQQQCAEPKPVLDSTIAFRDHVIEFIERKFDCVVENGDFQDLHYVRRKSEIGSFTPGHRDADFLIKDRSGIVLKKDDVKDFYTVWIPFMDVSRKHSHLLVESGSHLNVSLKKQRHKRKRLTWKRLLLPKYSLVIFNSMLHHKASVHTHQKEARTSIDFRFRIQFNKRHDLFS